LHEALRPGIPLVLTHHHFEPGESLESYDRIVFVSHTQLARVRKAVPLREDRTRVVHNPVAEEFRTVNVLPDDMREAIVYSGALIPRKGVDVVLEAASMHPVLRSHPLLICGEGQLDAKWARFVGDHNLDVRLLGKLSRQDLSELLARAKIMVLPSRMEGWSASINEAICCGTPVVGYASQILELRDLLGMEVGIPFDANTQSAGDLAQSMVEVLEGPQQRTSAREAMAAAAREYLSGDRFVRGYERVYAELIG
jgi:glycosyltransferase involved in cell wall biosynthesis